MAEYTLKHGAKLRTVDNDEPEENAVVFKIQAFKKSGKYYADYPLALVDYTKEKIEAMQYLGTEEEKSAVYHIISDLIDFLKNGRPFYQGMHLVVNCDSFFPIMIPAEGV